MSADNHRGVYPTAEEMRRRDDWAQAAFGGQGWPFSFIYGGRGSGEIIDGWTQAAQTETLPDGRTRQTITWRDDATGLEVRCVSIAYADFPAVEWTVYFRNTGDAATPIIEEIQALDIRLERAETWPPPGEFVLHHLRGDYCTADSYQPFSQMLWQNTAMRFAPVGGRPNNAAFPYFNIQTPDGGLIMAVGWPGQWAASFTRDAGCGLAVVAGQETTHLSLAPGEEIRSPLMALLFWAGHDGADVARGQNLWRRWMLAHNVPQTDGRPPAPLFAFCSGGFFPDLKCTEAGEKLFIDTLRREGVHLDYWWMDAGWYPCEGWPQVGTWEVDAERFPNGLKAVSDYVHAGGSQLIVWFEPERVAPGTWLYEQRPAWLLTRPGSDSAANPSQRWRLFNLGDPAARAWMTERVDQLLTEQGIDLYRQDYNIDPLPFWRAADAGPEGTVRNRQGVAENLYVQGYLAFWDELRRRHPGMLIDSCASGGRRNDLETLRRAVPLLRSDYQSFQGDPSFAPGNQGHTYGLAAWIPYFGQGVYYGDQWPYAVRSHLCPAFSMDVDVRREGIDWDLYRRLLGEWQEAAPFFLGDYYPLTPYSLAAGAWMAWQFHDPSQNAGMVQAFRHGAAPDATRSFQLRGLDPAAKYLVKNLTDRAEQSLTGAALMTTGLAVSLAAAPDAVILTYRKQ